MKQGNRNDLYKDEDFNFPLTTADFGVSTASTTIASVWDSYYIGYMNYYDAIDVTYTLTSDGGIPVVEEAWEIVGTGKRRSTNTQYSQNGQGSPGY